MRLSLIPNLRRLWRGPHTIQLGVDPASAIVLEFSTASAAAVLDLLDGSRTEEAILTQAATLGIEPRQTRAVIDALDRAGVLIPADTLLPPGVPESARWRLTAEAAALARRREVSTRTPADMLRRRCAGKVLVAGTGPLVAQIAITLAAAGVGHLDAARDNRPSDEGGDDGDVARQIIRMAPEVDVTPVRPGRATIVVRVGTRTPAALAARGYRVHRVATLAVAVRDAVVVVGPLVPPGGSPCERCLDLHRGDRDGDWPALAAQLATVAAPTETCPATTLLAGAAYAAEEVLRYLDGRPAGTSGATVEIGRPGQARRRSWPPHPRCDCHRTTRARRPAEGGRTRGNLGPG